MQRRSFIKNTAFTLGGLALLNKKTLAAFLADPAYNIKMLTDSIGIFSERGGTIMFMLGEKSIVVVDAQFPDTAQHCIDEIKKKSDRPFSLLINTHHHGDHTAGNIAFKDIVHHIVAHENSKINQQAAAVKNKTEEKQLYPDTTYTAKWTMKLKKERVTLYYMGRGHTNGDSFVHFEKANIVHTGDLVFNRRHPYVDRSAGASIKEWIKVLDNATSFFHDEVQYICGHAAPGYEVIIKKADVFAFRDYLENVLKYTSQSISKGITKAEFLKTTEIPGSSEWKGDGITRPLDAAWEELHEIMIR